MTNEDFGEVTTFYSYKGGTGRSMALANVACLLAKPQKGWVLMIDWDLEAPGLHRFFRKRIKEGSNDLS
jgi:MinD-like ATPase involved in chromosome partitioning or flagellar assembly